MASINFSFSRQNRRHIPQTKTVLDVMTSGMAGYILVNSFVMIVVIIVGNWAKKHLLMN
jgi:hypothetical protein